VAGLGATLGIVDDGAIGVSGDDHAGDGKHAHRSNGDAIDRLHAKGISQEIRYDGRRSDTEDRRDNAEQAIGKTLEDQNRRAGIRRVCGVLHGLLIDVGEIVCGEPDDHAGDEPGDGGPENAPGMLEAQAKDDGKGKEGEKSSGDHGAGVERSAGIIALTRANKDHADERGQDPCGAEQQRIDHVLLGSEGGLSLVKLKAQDHHRHHAGHKGVKDVGAHACHITHVVAHVVGDHGGVPRVILGQAELDLAHQVSADIGGFGIDAAAGLGQKSQGAGPKAKAEHHRGVVEDHKEQGHAYEGGAHYRKPHDGAGVERHRESLLEARARSPGDTSVGAGGNIHARVAGRRRTGRADEVSQGILPPDTKENDDGNNQRQGTQRLKQTFQVCGSPHLDRAGELDHRGVFVLLRHDPLVQVHGKPDGHEPGDQRNDLPEQHIRLL